QVHITEAGHEHVEHLMLQAGLLKEGESLYDPANIRLMHHLNAALPAHALHKRDGRDNGRGGQGIVLDEVTRRPKPGRPLAGGTREQPALVGTTSIETSEYLSGLLQKEGVEHQVLNAKQHEREAHVVAQAGRPGTVTIATNMAGRGTDIVLGGNLEAELAAAPPELDEASRERLSAEWQERHDKVLAAGGLHIVGTERHESRRIDNQLRGRSGPQGQPGSSRFYLSMEDNLMRIFGDPLRTQRLLKMAGMKEGEVIESGMLTRQIEKAQRKVEAHNFDIRKNLLLFDDVANDQRKVVYAQRTEIMGTEDLSGAIRGLMEDSVGSLLDLHMPKHAAASDWDLQGL